MHPDLVQTSGGHKPPPLRSVCSVGGSQRHTNHQCSSLVTWSYDQSQSLQNPSASCLRNSFKVHARKTHKPGDFNLGSSFAFSAPFVVVAVSERARPPTACGPGRLTLLNWKSSCLSRSLWDSWPWRLNRFILSQHERGACRLTDTRWGKRGREAEDRV